VVNLLPASRIAYLDNIQTHSSHSGEMQSKSGNNTQRQSRLASQRLGTAIRAVPAMN
jgi:hypothetical protein